MSREEKVSIAYGVGGFFISLHFAVIILNNIVAQVSSFLLLAGTGVVDDVLIRNSILSTFMYGTPSMIMVLIGLTLLFIYKRRLKMNYIKPTEEAVDVVGNRKEELRTVVFSVVGILVLLMSINFIINISIFQFDSVTGLFSFNTSEAYFKHSLILVGPQYLLSIGEGLLGLWLLLRSSKKILRSSREISEVDTLM